MQIFEPTPFSAELYGHKFMFAGLRYEVGVSIERGNLMWVNGAIPCGIFQDLVIFRHGVKKFLSENKKIVANKGYPDERCLKSDEAPTEHENLHGEIRAGNESASRRFKQFSALTSTFRHSLDLHGYVFHAIANLSHVSIELRESLFEIEFE